jgi:hypothetical protein
MFRQEGTQKKNYCEVNIINGLVSKILSILSEEAPCGCEN